MYHVVLETVPLFIQELQARLLIGSKFFLTKLNYHLQISKNIQVSQHLKFSIIAKKP